MPFCGLSGFSCHKSPIPFFFFASLAKIEAMVLGCRSFVMKSQVENMCSLSVVMSQVTHVAL